MNDLDNKLIGIVNNTQKIDYKGFTLYEKGSDLLTTKIIGIPVKYIIIAIGLYLSSQKKKR